MSVTELRPRWQDYAKCTGMHPNTFFPTKAHGRFEVARAKLICADCPVKVECLEYALLTEHGGNFGRHGVWGGTTVHERKMIANRRNRASRGV